MSRPLPSGGGGKSVSVDRNVDKDIPSSICELHTVVRAAADFQVSSVWER